MIWYLLYPFRGTTEPPILSDHHPIRRAFYRHGTLASRYWLLFLLTSVLISVTVLYAFFIGSPGLSTLPGHGWISARAYGSGQNLLEDVAVRRVWIHGDYMGALKPNVLQEALTIQNALINDQFPDLSLKLDQGHPKREIDAQCHARNDDDALLLAAFHSPLMYWNCSRKTISNDQDLLFTIHEQSARKSRLNLTLLPASVFSGKQFSGKQLKEADALVITQFDVSTARSLSSWDARLVKLAAEYSDQWLFYPGSGAMTASQLYEYQRELISTRDFTLLAVAYIMMLLYIAYRLKETRAVRSRVDLFAAIFTEIAISVCASFALCGMLKIDLSRIPQEMYPFVVLVIGLENMFRLMNAVMGQPLQIEPTKRIAKALGDVGHISLANATQNLGLLWLLSKVMNPATQSFCIFAGLALLFDFLFHLVFFVAVLSVEVRRMELQDSIGRIEHKNEGHKQRTTQSWLDALYNGRLPLSTRIAGSLICIGFTLEINVHFADSGKFGRSAVRFLLDTLKSGSDESRNDQYPFAPPPINQARTPQSWLKLQDHQFAQEVIEFIKPGASSMIARVYEPVIIVLKGSDRGREPLQEGLGRQLSRAFRGHILPVLFFIAIFIGLITALMDYLLWDNRTEEEKERASKNEEMAMSFKKLPLVHDIDIFQLSASSKGNVVAVSLDRSISAYSFTGKSQTFAADAITVPNYDSLKLWPISQMAIDNTGMWVAVCTSSGSIGVWNRSKRLWTATPSIDSGLHLQCLLEYSTRSTIDKQPNRLYVAFQNGLHVVVNVETNEIIFSIKLPAQIISTVLAETTSESFMLSVTSSGRIHAINTSKSSPDPILDRLLEIVTHDAEDRIRAIQFSASLNLLVAIRRRSVDLIDFTSRLTVACVHLTDRIVPSSLRVLHSLPRRCRTCHSPAVNSFSLAYNMANTKGLLLRTFTADTEEHRLICFHPTTNSAIASCRTIQYFEAKTKTVQSPGNWEVTSYQTIVGIRPKSGLTDELRPSQNLSPESKPHYLSSATLSKTSTARRRLTANFQPVSRRTSIDSQARDESFSATSPMEIWSLSPDTEMMTKDIPPSSDDLLVVTPGPIVPLGARSVAFAFGNSVRVVTIGAERIEEDISNPWGEEFINGHISGKVKPKEVKKRKGVSVKNENKLHLS